MYYSDRYLNSVIFHPLDMLKQIEVSCGINDSNDRIKFLKRELKLLDTFVGSMSFTNECNLPDVIQNVEIVLEETGNDLSEIYYKKLLPEDPNLDSITSHVMNKILMTKMEIREKYSSCNILLQLSVNKDVIASPDFVMEFINNVVENFCDLVKSYDPCSVLFVQGSKEQIEEALKELKLLRSFVCFVLNRCKDPENQQNFFNHILVVASHATIISWLYLPGNDSGTQELTSGEMDIFLSDLLRMRIKPIQPCIREIYIDVLQVLKSTIQSGWHPNIQNEHAADIEVGFVETILHNLVELPTSISNDQIGTLQEMLDLLRANLINLPVSVLEVHLQDIDSVIVDAGLLVYSLYDNEEEREDIAVGKMNNALLDFPSVVQSIQAVIDQNTRT